ncbi:UPF0481 protein At3g47200-like [Telopea speciosissima]|uniref:UPF0481 protein At3g47200-like n=1 Tax=Telopea speciosissima TaxID=54955 RepID=UPI001CC4A344|nr:UPF0481 protein At3g47200-like [Telopea speciosissima]
MQVNDNHRDTKMKTNQIAFASRDLFLLENQLPFLVLEALMSFRHREKYWQDLIHKFVKMPLNLESNTSPENEDYKPAHLLDLLHKKLIGHDNDQHRKSEPSKKSNDGKHTFRSVFELKKSGIECKRSEGGSLRNVYFINDCIGGDLVLPHIVIDDLTKSILLNLVAYEASPDGPSDYVVTSYIVLLDALIDSPEDMKELRSKEYLEVKRKIEKYNKNKISIWMTDFRQTHFSSPWTVVAFFVALTIIILTCVQTYYAIKGDRGEGERKAPTPSRKIHSFG